MHAYGYYISRQLEEGEGKGEIAFSKCNCRQASEGGIAADISCGVSRSQ